MKGSAAQQLEQEVKLELGPGQERAEWSPPDLQEVAPGARLEKLPALLLEATYFDTPSRGLNRRGVTLRRRVEAVHRDEVPAAAPETGPAAGPETGTAAGPETGTAASLRCCSWTVKLPTTVSGAVLSRAEVNWGCDAADEPPEGSPVLPEELARFLAGVSLGEPLVPVAKLRTLRRRWRLAYPGGTTLSEISHDEVEGTVLGGAGATAAALQPVRFDELEVELGQGVELELLDAIVSKLVEGGARRSSRRSKYATVLEAAAPQGTEVGEPGHGRGAHAATLSDVLAVHAQACLDVLLEHDLPIRLNDPDPEHVHKSRVAVRRLRTILRAFAPLLVAPAPGGAGGPGRPSGEGAGEAHQWVGVLAEELRWLGSSLGQARDADVRLASLERSCSELLSCPGPKAGGPVPASGRGYGEGVLAAARQEQAEAHKALLEAMGSERYVRLLQALQALGAPTGRSALGGALPKGRPQVPPELWARLSQPAAKGMSRLVRRRLRSLRRAVRLLGPRPSEAALHKVRIKAKQLRYVAEAAEPVLATKKLRKAAQAIAGPAAHLQDVLGELHDSAVHELWLGALASREPEGSETAQVAALLISATEKSRESLAREWPRHWRALERQRPRKWR